MLGIDPSLRGTGLGIVDFGTAGPSALHHETIRCPPVWTRSRCLGRIATVVRDLIARHQPRVCVVEGLFFAQNLKTAITMGEARGAALSAVGAAEIPVYEVAPRQVKLAIVGYGGAQKIAVAKMVQRLLGLAEVPDADAADALALALAFGNESRRRTAPGRKPL